MCVCFQMKSLIVLTIYEYYLYINKRDEALCIYEYVWLYMLLFDCTDCVLYEVG